MLRLDAGSVLSGSISLTVSHSLTDSHADLVVGAEDAERNEPWGLLGMLTRSKHNGCFRKKIREPSSHPLTDQCRLNRYRVSQLPEPASHLLLLRHPRKKVHSDSPFLTLRMFI